MTGVDEKEGAGGGAGSGQAAVAPEYSGLLREIKERIRSAQYEALRAVNRELVKLYWDIGGIIVERQEREGWGKAIIEKLAEDLRAEFPDVKGFSARNLWNMRTVFASYAGSPILQTLSAEITWSHNLVIAERCSEELEREFYLRMAKRLGWSTRVLIHQIEGRAYEQALRVQTNFNKALPLNITR